jgi:hypothetical protein
MIKRNEEIQKAYQEILTVCEKHKELSENTHMRDIQDMVSSSRNHLAIVDWSEKYGIDIPHDKRLYGSNYMRISEYISFSYYKDGEVDKENGSGKFISWSDDGSQPEDEWLLVISFSTGAYIFGRDYDGQKQLFIDFFNELKSYKPKYSDTVNHSLYWSMDNAGKIYKDFAGILEKYRKRNGAELKEREVLRLKDELAKLEETK